MTHQDDLLKQYPNLKEFLPYLDLLRKESPRGQVLISAGYIEEQLKQVLLAFMRDDADCINLLEGGNAPLGTLSSRIAACYALGLINENERHDLTLIRKIRNDFAHDMHTTFDTPSVVDRCKELRFKAHDYGSKEMGDVVIPPAGQFQTDAVGLILNLVNRPHYVTKQRRIEQNWPY